MQPIPFGLPAPWAAALERLAQRPALLVSIVLAVNALVHPYRGLDHDARLYAAQIVERVEPGSLSADLYLRYGSQDRYSMFSALMVPLVRATDLHLAFFLAYLLSKLLFFVALTRLVLKLIPDQLAAVLSLLFLAMAPLPFGGNEVIRLNESFLTPRIGGSALILFALERVLTRRFAQAVGLIVLGLSIHPLMAFAGALVLLLWLAFERLSLRWAIGLGVLAAIAGAGVVFYQPLGRGLFGYMDEDWRTVTYQVCFFVDPAVWTVGDWLRIGSCAGIAILAVWIAPRERRALAAALIVAAFLGIAGNFAAANFHYRLLIQTSPYRTLWLLELLAIPFAFLAVSRLWSAGRFGPFAGLAIAIVFTADWNSITYHPAVVFVLLLPVVVVWQRGLKRVPRMDDWPTRAASSLLLAGTALLFLVNVTIVAHFLRIRPTLDNDSHPVLLAQRTGEFLFKLPLLAAVLVFLARGNSARWRLAPLSVFLLVQGSIGWLDASSAYQARYSLRQHHAHQVGDFLNRRSAELGRTPSVYWTTDLRDIWFTGRASAFFHSVQLSGCAFNRGTAIEGQRRARLVRHFEATNLRRCRMPQSWWQEALESFYDAGSAHPPSEADLLALCAEPGLDFVIVTERFDGLYRDTDGYYYIYDCAQLRRLARSR